METQPFRRAHDAVALAGELLAAGVPLETLTGAEAGEPADTLRVHARAGADWATIERVVAAHDAGKGSREEVAARERFAAHRAAREEDRKAATDVTKPIAARFAALLRALELTEGSRLPDGDEVRAARQARGE